MKSFYKYIIIAVTAVILGTAGAVVCTLPLILNSDTAVKKYEQFLSAKTGTDVSIDGFKFKLNRNFTFDITVKNIEAKDKKDNVVDFKNIDYKSNRLSIKPEKLNIDSIYLDFEKLKPHLNTGKKDSGSSLKMDYLPVINIKKAVIRFDEKSNAKFVNIHSEKVDGIVFCSFKGYLTVPYSKEPIIIGEDGYVYFTKNVNFEDFTLSYKNSKLYLTGAVDNLNFNGKDLSVYDLENFFVFFYKTKHPGKRNFIENFVNFKGTLDIDLNLKNGALNGKCTARNLEADFSKFKIPVSLPVVDFYFTGRDMKAAASGTFGPDGVYTDVLVRGIATDNIIVHGNVKSKLSDKFTQTYFKPVRIEGYADASVQYMTKNKKVDIKYTLDLAPGNNIITGYGSLDNTGKYRQIQARTLKIGDKLHVKDYSYAFIDGNKEHIHFSGSGLFEKIKGSFSPVYFTMKTNGIVPMSVIDSFVDDYITGGSFRADLKCDFLKKIIDGNLSIFNSNHFDFMHIKQADVNVSKEKIDVSITGKFFKSPITIKLAADNNFENDITIDDIDIKLDKFYISRGNISDVKSTIKKQQTKLKPKPHKTKQYNFTVNNGKIHVGEIIHTKFYLHDVDIFGTLHNDIVDFTVYETEYAKGILSAAGKYNVKKHSSDIHFIASDIDSDEVAAKIFNLPNQFEGTGYATLHMETKNKLNDIHAHATFAIADGFLPKLGSREIIVNKSNDKKSPFAFLKKSFSFTLSKITNIDFSKPNVFYSNLRGTFVIDNSRVHNVKIFSQSDNLSLFLNGNYDISTQIGDLSVWGRHNKAAERKIKVFKIPLSIIHKILFRVERTKQANDEQIKQIPPIKASASDEGLFRVKVNGNLNTDDIKVELKDIR